jgi:hypothetical protein
MEKTVGIGFEGAHAGRHERQKGLPRRCWYCLPSVRVARPQVVIDSFAQLSPVPWQLDITACGSQGQRFGRLRLLALIATLSTSTSSRRMWKASSRRKEGGRCCEQQVWQQAWHRFDLNLEREPTGSVSGYWQTGAAWERETGRDDLVYQWSRCYLLLESCDEGDNLPPLLGRLEGFESTTASLEGMMKERRDWWWFWGVW